MGYSQIDELNYNNNIGYFSLHIDTPPQGNDLNVENVQSPQHHVGSPGGDWNISYRVYNMGQGSTASSTGIKIYASYDKVLSPDDVLLQEEATNQISVGQYEDFSSFIHIPSGFPTGTYLYMLIKVNPDNTIQELNTENNVNQFSFHIGTPPSGIDLTVEGLTSTQHHVGSPGGDWNIDYKIGNIGQGTTAPSSAVKIYLSDDTEYSSDDTFLAEDSVNPLSVGEFQNMSTFIHIPSGFSNEYKNLLVITNPDKITSSHSYLEKKVLSVNAFPNPCNSFVTFEYSLLSNNMSVNLDIYDIMGKKMKTILLDPSVKSISISDIGLQSGIYFYHVVTNKGCSEIQRLIITK